MAPPPSQTAWAEIRIEPLNARNMAQTLEVYNEIRPGIARLAGHGIYRAVCSEALRDPRVRIVAAFLEGCVVGYCGAVSDWKAYWKHFLPRHPWLAFLSAGSTVMRKLRGRGPDRPPTEEQIAAAREWLLPEPSGRVWKTWGPDVGKVIGVGVSERARGLGIGTLLYDALARDLDRTGVTRMDAMVRIDNLASLKMHTRAGFGMELRGSVWVFGSRVWEPGRPERRNSAGVEQREAGSAEPGSKV